MSAVLFKSTLKVKAITNGPIQLYKEEISYELVLNKFN